MINTYQSKSKKLGLEIKTIDWHSIPEKNKILTPYSPKSVKSPNEKK